MEHWLDAGRIILLIFNFIDTYWPSIVVFEQMRHTQSVRVLVVCTCTG